MYNYSNNRFLNLSTVGSRCKRCRRIQKKMGECGRRMKTKRSGNINKSIRELKKSYRLIKVMYCSELPYTFQITQSQNIVVIIIMLAYLYCAAYTRMTMHESSPPREQRRITFNDDADSTVGSTRVTSAALHFHVQAATNYTPSPSRHYYPWLIAGTNLPTPKGWIA